MKKQFLVFTTLLAMSSDAFCIKRAEIPPKTTEKEFYRSATKAFIAGCAINGIAAFSKDGYLPTSALLAGTAIIATGRATLRYLDNRDLQKDPSCGANRIHSPFLNTLVIAAGMTPLLFSESAAGDLARRLASPAYEAVLGAGNYVAGCVLTGLTMTGRSNNKK